MSYNEEETRHWLINPVLDRKGYDSPLRLKLETQAPIDPSGPKGRRIKRNAPNRLFTVRSSWRYA